MYLLYVSSKWGIVHDLTPIFGPVFGVKVMLELITGLQIENGEKYLNKLSMLYWVQLRLFK